MAVTLGNLLLVAGSVLAAVCALFWPNIEQACLARVPHHGSTTGAAKGKCPLGYEGTMPANHPPVPGGLKQSAGVGPRQTSSPGSKHVTFVNTVIWTADTAAPWAVNMTVDLATGDITHMGYADSSSDSSSGSSTGGGSGVKPQHVVDMQGAFLMPGFVDPHVHLIPGGLSLRNVNLRGLRAGRQQMADRLAAAAGRAAAPSGSSSSSDGEREAWLIGTGWSESDWGGQLPDRSWIDEACGGRPAFLTRMDGHMALVNTAALQAAGLLTTQPAADGGGGAADTGSEAAAAVAAADAEGLIDRDPNTGLPTGLLRESAMLLVESLIPPPSVADRAAALQDAGRYLMSHGVTSVGDMGWALFGPGSMTWEDLEAVYDEAAAQGSMPVRVSAYVPLRTWKRLASRVAAKGTSHPHSSRLLWGGVKEFADGSLGSNTALMWEPYLNTAAASAAAGDHASKSRGSSGGGSSGHDSGTRTIPTDELLELVKGATGAGLQVAVHAIGDRAVDEVTQVFEHALGDSSSSSSRGGSRVLHRIEHVQHISSPAAAAKLAAGGVAGVLNPQHLLTDRSMLLSKLGLDRAGPGRAFAYKTLADAGVDLGFGSDWPVVEIDPWTSAFAAVYRKDPPATTGSAAAAAIAVDGSCGSNEGSSSMSDRVWESEEECLNLNDVLMGHTFHAARVARLDHLVGKLAPGFKADFIVLDKSPFDDEAHDVVGSTVGRSAGSAASDSAVADGVQSDAVVGSKGGGLSGLLHSGVPVVVQTYMDGACVFGC